MTITTTIDKRTVFGDLRVVIGHCANTGTGGNVVTGLDSLFLFLPINLGATAAEISVNSVFPLASGTAVIVTESSVTFAWIAIGL